MKKFLKENWFKLFFCLLSTILVFILSGTLVDVTQLLVEKRLNFYELRRRQEKLDRLATESELFDRKIRCQDMIDKFKKRYNNVVGGSYNELWNACDIEYRNKGKKESTNMEFMSDN